jgi:hypothetical protein
MLEALEMWIFAADAGLFSKKKEGNPVTLTGMFMQDAKHLMQTTRSDMMTRFDSDAGTSPGETASSSSTLASPPPSIPDDLPLAK